MKAFLVLFAFMSVSASAQNITVIEKGDLSISQAKGKISSVKPICPRIPGRPSCMAVGSTVTIKVNLNGCVDRLGGFFTKFEVIDGHGVLFFSGINIANKALLTARCVAAPFETVKVGIPFEGEVELVNTDYTAVHQAE